MIYINAAEKLDEVIASNQQGHENEISVYFLVECVYFVELAMESLAFCRYDQSLQSV